MLNLIMNNLYANIGTDKKIYKRTKKNAIYHYHKLLIWKKCEKHITSQKIGMN